MKKPRVRSRGIVPSRGHPHKAGWPGCRKLYSQFPGLSPALSAHAFPPCALQLHSRARRLEGLARSSINPGQSVPLHLAAGFTTCRGKIKHCRQSHYLLRSPYHNVLRFAKYSAQCSRGDVSPFTMRLCCTKAIKGISSSTALNPDLSLSGFKQTQVSLSSVVVYYLHTGTTQLTSVKLPQVFAMCI